MTDVLRVATWNLWWRFGGFDQRAPLILDALRSIDADVIGLQEVWFDDHENQAATIAAALGFDHRFVPSPAPEKWQRRIDDARFGIGNAVLSRWPIATTDTVRLTTGGAADEGRVALQTTIESPHGSVSFSTTHLNSTAGQSAIRAEQLAGAVRLVAQHADADVPAMLCGDFNAGPHEPEITAALGGSNVDGGIALIDGWPTVRPADPGHTWDVENPHVAAHRGGSHRIDYLLIASPEARQVGRPVDAGLIGTVPTNGVWPSDHFGVWLDLDTGRA